MKRALNLWRAKIKIDSSRRVISSRQTAAVRITKFARSVAASGAASVNPRRPRPATVKDVTKVTTEDEREVAGSAVAFHPVSESSSGSRPLPSNHQLNHSIKYPITSKEAGKALVTSLWLREFTGGGDYLVSDVSTACLPLYYAIKT
ncbi:hypothetical protein EVAR_10749_1 [Eumeta japonica]|uniref:Uncharacterized protein n=1 Tax=Eumeta variegata TaxID=151549 RepID=A0A4C1W6T9_EUMVA|nr:hypothetical protein EVAR_10749_1 [Eumeta japonica]